MTAKYEDSIAINLDKEQLIEMVETALDKSNMVVKRIDKVKGEILAKAKLSLWSWTEDIIVNVTDDGNIKIKSTCAFPFQFYDWGKNKRNVNKIITNLK